MKGSEDEASETIQIVGRGMKKGVVGRLGRMQRLERKEDAYPPSIHADPSFTVLYASSYPLSCR